jgi:hypothetical protein
MAIVAELPADLSPSPGDLGLATQDRTELARRTVRAWELLTSLAENADLAGDTRAGRTAKELLTGIGRWPDSRWVAEVREEAAARTSAPGRTDQDAEEERLRTAHRRATRATILQALRRSGAEAEAFLGSPDDDTYGTRLVASQLGPLPLRTFLHATAYRVAIAGRDLEPALLEPMPAELTELVELGFVALVDVLGALSAREGLSTWLTGVTDQGHWVFAAEPDRWRVTEVHEQPPGPAIVASARTLLDITAGRAEDVGGLYRRGEIRLEDVPGMLRLAPLLDQVPGIPGASGLKLAARSLELASRTLGRAGSALGKLRRSFG